MKDDLSCEHFTDSFPVIIRYHNVVRREKIIREFTVRLCTQHPSAWSHYESYAKTDRKSIIYASVYFDLQGRSTAAAMRKETCLKVS